jgi:putative SOS response-associated peptidase YedK
MARRSLPHRHHVRTPAFFPQNHRPAVHDGEPRRTSCPPWNMAPTKDSPVVRRHLGERHLDVRKWGLVPYFTKGLKEARKPINARSETVATSGMFRAAFAKRRCLVPPPLPTSLGWRQALSSTSAG